VRLSRRLLLIAFLVGSQYARAGADEYQIGVYYFPGWKDNQAGATYALPWEKIKPFPERQPLIGWYKEGSVDVMQRQIEWMHNYGIKFVVFDWYFDSGRRVLLDHAISAFMRAQNRSEIKFAILWANHDGMPRSYEDWDTMVHAWLVRYFNDPQFLRIDGMPVVFVFSADMLKNNAESFGSTTKKLIARAQALAKVSGLSGIYFVAGTEANTTMISSYAKGSGYSAFSAYNYHSSPVSHIVSHSFKELSADYQKHWNKFAREGNLPLIVPLTSGWDHTPWGRSNDQLHDNSRSTSEEFESHLNAAKSFMDMHRAQTKGFGVICCWNEYGEGSYIEPTKGAGISYLEKVRSVFERSGGHQVLDSVH
jgi:hypothetical protein